MACQVLQQNNLICGRSTYYREERCYIHIRKWIQERLKVLGIIRNYPRKIGEIESGLNLIKSIDPTYKDYYEYNILHRGAIDNDINLFKQGLEIGISINSKTAANYTPLHLIRDNINLMQLCLKSGADVNALDESRNTPLILRCRCCYYPFVKKTIKLLLKWGADPTIKNIYGLSSCDVMLQRCEWSLPKKRKQKHTLNLLTIVNVWNTGECINWRESIISRFINRLPNISNRGALFDVFYEYFEFSHILCIQNA